MPEELKNEVASAEGENNREVGVEARMEKTNLEQAQEAKQATFQKAEQARAALETLSRQEVEIPAEQAAAERQAEADLERLNGELAGVDAEMQSSVSAEAPAEIAPEASDSGTVVENKAKTPAELQREDDIREYNRSENEHRTQEEIVAERKQMDKIGDDIRRLDGQIDDLLNKKTKEFDSGIRGKEIDLAVQQQELSQQLEKISKRKGDICRDFTKTSGAQVENISDALKTKKIDDVLQGQIDEIRKKYEEIKVPALFGKKEATAKKEKFADDVRELESRLKLVQQNREAYLNGGVLDQIDEIEKLDGKLKKQKDELDESARLGRIALSEDVQKKRKERDQLDERLKQSIQTIKDKEAQVARLKSEKSS
jgi:hypothetical protein